MFKRIKKADIKYAQDLKTQGGVRIKHMQDFFLEGNISYSLEEIASFSREAGGVSLRFE
jgi:hypothetical protein